MHAVERELIKATGYKTQRKFDNRQDYLGSVLNAVLKLSDDDFDTISDDAAAWANAATEAKNSKAEELPDFDEVNYSGEPAADDEEGDDDGDPDPEDATDDSGDDDVDEDEVSEDDPDEADEVEDEPEPVKAKKTAPKKVEKTKAAPAKEKSAPRKPSNFDEDAVLDKFGCIEGSKNSQALAMFEKGATAREVKEAIGGTYYNILGKCVKNGHKLEKEGALIKLTHKDQMGAKKIGKKK